MKMNNIFTLAFLQKFGSVSLGTLAAIALFWASCTANDNAKTQQTNAAQAAAPTVAPPQNAALATPKLAAKMSNAEANTPKLAMQRTQTVAEPVLQPKIEALLAEQDATRTPQYFDQHESEELEEREESVGERLQFEFDMLKDPATGKIPRLAASKALEAAYNAPSYAPLWSPESSIPGVTITAKGPNNLGGRTRAIGIDVSNTNVMIAGSVSSGVFRTTDGGTSWRSEERRVGKEC